MYLFDKAQINNNEKKYESYYFKKFEKSQNPEIQLPYPVCKGKQLACNVCMKYTDQLYEEVSFQVAYQGVDSWAESDKLSVSSKNTATYTPSQRKNQEKIAEPKIIKKEESCIQVFDKKLGCFECSGLKHLDCQFLKTVS